MVGMAIDRLRGSWQCAPDGAVLPLCAHAPDVA
jgi:hypothetical protein